MRSATAATKGLDRALQTNGRKCRAAGEAASAAELYYEGKLHACAYFFRHELPKTRHLAAILVSLDSTVADMRLEWF